MEIKPYFMTIEFIYDKYITCYMARQLKLYILANPYIDDVASMKFINGNTDSNKKLFTITVLHHASDDKTINTIINKLFTDFLNHDILFTKSKRIP